MFKGSDGSMNFFRTYMGIGSSWHDLSISFIFQCLSIIFQEILFIDNIPVHNFYRWYFRIWILVNTCWEIGFMYTRLSPQFSSFVYVQCTCVHNVHFTCTDDVHCTFDMQCMHCVCISKTPEWLQCAVWHFKYEEWAHSMVITNLTSTLHKHLFNLAYHTRSLNNLVKVNIL